MDKWILGILPVYLGIMALLHLFVPPAMNASWGYRTSLSLKNEKTWYHAQKIYGKKLLLASVMMAPLLIIRFMLAGGFAYTLLFFVFELVILCFAAVSTAQTLLRSLQK